MDAASRRTQCRAVLREDAGAHVGEAAAARPFFGGPVGLFVEDGLGRTLAEAPGERFEHDTASLFDGEARQILGERAEGERQAKLDAEAQKEQAQKRLTQVEKANDILGSIFENLDPREIAKAERPLQAILVEKLFHPPDWVHFVLWPPVILAPMSGVTDLPFRRLVKRCGAGLVVSEMIASEAMIRESRRSMIMARSAPDEFPMAVQLAGCEPHVMAEAAKRSKVVFIDTWKRFSGLSGGFAEVVQDPRDNEFKDVRAEDGFHLNETGAEILALDIAEAIRADLRARGAAL